MLAILWTSTSPDAIVVTVKDGKTTAALRKYVVTQTTFNGPLPSISHEIEHEGSLYEVKNIVWKFVSQKHLGSKQAWMVEIEVKNRAGL